MDNKKLKRIMTDLAAGHISKKEADKLVKGLKTRQIKPKKEIEGKPDTHTRKKAIKSREEK